MKDETLGSIEAAIKEKEIEFESFKRKRASALERSEEQELAVVLHEKLCKHTHTDGCAWYYEGDDWKQWTHNYYLKKAEDIIDKTPNLSNRERITLISKL